MNKIKKSIEIKMDYFVAESLAMTKAAYKEIDKVFKTNRNEFIKSAKASKYYNEFNGEIIQEDYYRKALGIITFLENDEIIEFLKRIFKKEYSFVKCSKEEVKFSKLIKKNLGVFEINTSMLMTFLFCENLEKQIDLIDPAYDTFAKIMIQMSQALTYKSHHSYENISKSDKKVLRDIELTLKNKYIPNTKAPLIDIKFDTETGIIITDKITDYIRQVMGIDAVFELEHIDITSLAERNALTSREIQEIILTYMNTRFDKDGFIEPFEESIKTLNMDRLYEFVILAMKMRVVLKAYNAAKKYYFQNIDETLREEKLKQDEEIKNYKFEINLLKNQNNNLIKEIEKLEKANKRIQDKLNKSNENKGELNQLRELMFNLYQDQEQHSDEIIDINNLNKANAICFGGSDRWMAAMKECLPGWTFVPVAENFDVAILKGKEYIFVNTVVNSHGMYYKIIDNKDQASKIRYINNVNIDRCLFEIKKAIGGK